VYVKRLRRTKAASDHEASSLLANIQRVEWTRFGSDRRTPLLTI